MPRSNATRILILILFILTVALGYNYFFHPFAQEETPVAVEPTPVPSQNSQPEINVSDLIALMSPEQKIAQLLAMPVGLVASAPLLPTTQTNPSEQTTPFTQFELDIQSTGQQAGSQSAGQEMTDQEAVTQNESSTQDLSQASQAAAQEAFLAEIKPGFVTIFGEDLPADRTQERIRTLRDVAALTLPLDDQPKTIKPAFAVDHEGGGVQRLSGQGFTVLPSWQEMCGQEQASRAAILRQSSLELKSAGIDIVLAPVVDIATNNTILKDRICDDDPATVSAKATEYAALFDFAEITPVVKHFPGIGQTTRDLHFAYQSINPNQAELNVFRYVMDGFPDIGIMTTFTGVTAQDPNTPCALSKDCVGQLVSEYPRALLFTDALEMVAAGTQKTGGSASLTKRTELAIRAGNHVLIYGEGVDAEEFAEIISNLTELYNNDQEFAVEVDGQLVKVLEYKQRRGLL